MDTREVGPFRSSLLDIAAHGTFLDTRAKMKLEETQPNVGFGFLTPNQSNISSPTPALPAFGHLNKEKADGSNININIIAITITIILRLSYSYLRLRLHSQPVQPGEDQR